MESRRHFISIIIIAVIYIQFSSGHNITASNSSSNRLFLEIIRSSDGDILVSNLALQCHVYNAKCIEKGSSLVKDCHRCQCVVSATFMIGSVVPATGLPTGICTRGVKCGTSGSQGLPSSYFLKNSLQNKALDAINVSQTFIDHVVGTNGEVLPSPCSLFAAFLVNSSPMKLIKDTFTVTSTATQEKTPNYRVQVKWKVKEEKRIPLRGKMGMFSLDCGKNRPCMYFKVAGSVRYLGIVVPTQKPKTVTPLTTPGSTIALVTSQKYYTSTRSTTNTSSNVTKTTAGSVVTTPMVTKKPLTAITGKISTTTKGQVPTTHKNKSIYTGEPTTGQTTETNTIRTTFQPSSSKDSNLKKWLIIAGICLVLTLIVIAIAVALWMYWRKKKKYCYDGAPIFTRLERASVDSQRPDFVTSEDNMGTGDLRHANDNIGVDDIDNGSKEDLMEANLHDLELDPRIYEPSGNNFFSPKAAENTSQLVNNNKNSTYDTAKFPEDLELKNRAYSEEDPVPTNYQSLSDESRAGLTPYQGLGDSYYKSLNNQREPRPFYTGLVKGTSPAGTDVDPEYSVVDYEQTSSADPRFGENEYAEYERGTYTI